MPAQKASEMRMHSLERIADEKILNELSVSSLEELRRAVLQHCEKNHPVPVMVKMQDNSYKDSFVLDLEYDMLDPDAIFETILYSLDDPNSPSTGVFVDPVQHALALQQIETIWRHAKSINLTSNEQKILDAMVKNLLDGQNYDLEKKMVEVPLWIKTFLILKSYLRSYAQEERNIWKLQCNSEISCFPSLLVSLIILLQTKRLFYVE